MIGGKVSTPPPRERTSTPSAASAHQNSLLKLLNQTASGSTKLSRGDSVPEVIVGVQPSVTGGEKTKNGTSPDRNHSPIHYFGSKENTPLPFDTTSIGKSSHHHQSDSQTYANPFEIRTASSPSARKARLSRTSPNGGTTERKSKSPSPVTDKSHSAPRSKQITNNQSIPSDDISFTSHLQTIKRSHAQAAMGNSFSLSPVTVAEALSDIGDQVDREIGDKLAEAEQAQAAIKQEPDENAEEIKWDSIQAHIHEAAVGLKDELDKSENEDALREVLPTPAGEAVKDVIEEAAAEPHGTEGSNDMGSSDREIKVYQFPMRPFVSIDLKQQSAPAHALREGSDLPVARFKKDFDQSDRSLGAATTGSIAYAMPKATGGVRVIEQESGNHSLIFPETNDRVFNVAIGTGVGSTSSSTQNVIATGVSGTVYWTNISESGEHLPETEMLDRSIRFPPTQAGSDSSAGGQLKTRAKKSNRHPGFFAIGRGKSIQIVFPEHARSSEHTTNGVVDTEQYFRSRSLKLMPGKAGKDFVFSEDDTVIATLDKAGKLRLWDVRDLTDDAHSMASRLAPVEVKTPLLVFPTVSASEKSWPTSVLFVDKSRPYTKCSALRYIIIGMKQNHTLQLWDLCLGKPVQELNFSHESETDPICSVCYHPGTGIIIVGHPTRNSIYFIHLSAPKYNLSNISQAKFAQRLANGDTNLPKADATAIMSGIREYSLAEKGQLRSVELTQALGDTVSAEGDEEPALFELIIMHSKGVMCLGVKKADLGWSEDCKVLHPVDAEKEGIIVVKDLKELGSSQTSEPSQLSANGDLQAPSSPSKGLSPKPSKEYLKANRSETSMPGQASDKKKEKKRGNIESPAKIGALTETAEKYANAAQKGVASKSELKSGKKSETSHPQLSKQVSQNAPEPRGASLEERQTRSAPNFESINAGTAQGSLDKEIEKIEQSVSHEFHKVLSKEFDGLYKHIAEDKRVQDAAGAAKQDAMLRLISSVLDDNVEKSLSRIVQKSIQEDVVPAVEKTTMASLDQNLSSIITVNVQNLLPSIFKHSVADTLSRVLHGPEMVNSMSDQISKALSGHIERELISVLHKTITPTFQNLALSISQKISGETERRVRDHLHHFDQLHRNDSLKIDQLVTLVSSLSDMVQTMADAQSQFQDEILKLQQKAVHAATVARPGESPTPSESASMHASPEQEELGTAIALLGEGRYEDATITVSLTLAAMSVGLIGFQWLQSTQQVALFDNLLYRYNPGYLARSAPLVVLSVAAAVTSSLETHTIERLEWLDIALKHIVPSVSPEDRQT